MGKESPRGRMLNDFVDNLAAKAGKFLEEFELLKSQMEHESDQELNSLASIVNIQASELFPKKPTTADDPSLSVTFPLLHGEYVCYLGSTTDGLIALSNFRLFIHVKETFFNIPLGLIEQVECREIFYLYVYCKDAQSVKCTFGTNEPCLEWYKRLTAATSSPKKLEDLFAFAFYAWCTEESRLDLHHTLTFDFSMDASYSNLMTEAERMGFNFKLWRISRINRDHRLCPTYPKDFIVPASIEDEVLGNVANFRSSRRIPVVVWRHQKNGCVLARCSQPEVGWFGRRDSKDEDLIVAIARACAMDATLGTTKEPSTDGPGIEDPLMAVAEPTAVPSSSQKINTTEPKDLIEKAPKMLILDARSYAAAVANRAKGGGCECPEYYPNCEIQFMSLANIHSIRKSFQSVRLLCVSSPEMADWYSVLEGTKWLYHISGLLKSALVAVNAIDRDAHPVLVHCSDGWDRTPQIVALAELLLDPYYRTLEGFQVLVEREWLDFGHKFGDRCGHGHLADDANERCPVFLQWLDCVHQLLLQFPCSFEFNQSFLVKLVQHTYSCLFGTFLCNSTEERKTQHVADRTYSVWAFFKVNQNRFRNYLYVHNDQVLRPSCHVRDLTFWSAMYLPKNATTDEVSQNTPASCDSVTTVADSTSKPDGKDGNTSQLAKTRSWDDLSAAGQHASASGRQRRKSDPSVGDGGKRPFQNRDTDTDEDEAGDDQCPQSGTSPLLVPMMNGCWNGKRAALGDRQRNPSMIRRSQWDSEDSSDNNDESCNEDEDKESNNESNGHCLAVGSPATTETAFRGCGSDVITCDSSTDTLVGELASHPNDTCSSSEVPVVHSMGRCTTGSANSNSNSSSNSNSKGKVSVNCVTSTVQMNGDCSSCAPSLPLTDGVFGFRTRDSLRDQVWAAKEMQPSPRLSRCAYQSVCTSTSDISDSHVCGSNLGGVTSCPVNPSVHDLATPIVKPGLNGHNHGSAWSRMIPCARCPFCINGKKLPLPFVDQGGIGIPGVVVGSIDGIAAGLTAGGTNSTNPATLFKPSASSSCRNSVGSTPLHSRTPSSGFPATPNDDRMLECLGTRNGATMTMAATVTSTSALLARKMDIDGLTMVKDEVQQRLCQIELARMSKIKALRRELDATQLMLYNHVIQKCGGTLGNQEVTDDVGSLPDSVGSGEHQSLGQESNSDLSWEHVDEHDVHPTLWVPDHAVSRCMGCEIEFWLGCRRHHCRNCGKIFCADCSNQMIPIPNEQLYNPVRVCYVCFEKLRSSQRCRQACAEAKLSKSAAMLTIATTAAASN